MYLKTTDVMLQINENLTSDQRYQLESYMKQQVGVNSLQYHDNKQHIMTLAYNPECITPGDLLTRARFKGVKAELVQSTVQLN